MRRYHLPLYLTEKTYLAARSSLGKIDESLVHLITPETPFAVRDTEILPFSTPHDAVDSVGFRVLDSSGDIGVVQICYFSRDVRTALCGCRCVLESNYDVDMLKTDLIRVFSNSVSRDAEDISNEEAGEAGMACPLWNRGAVAVSSFENNNNPGRAMVTVRSTSQERYPRGTRLSPSNLAEVQVFAHF